MEDERNRTLWVGNLPERVTEKLLYELFLQAGPLEKVKLVIKDRRSPNYAFITFKHACSVPYTIKLLEGIKLYGSYMKIQTRSGSVHDGQGYQGQGSPNPYSHGMGQSAGYPHAQKINNEDAYIKSNQSQRHPNDSYRPMQKSGTWHGYENTRQASSPQGNVRGQGQHDSRNMDMLSLTGQFNVTSPQSRDMDPLSMQLKRERLLNQQNKSIDAHRQQQPYHHMQNPYERTLQQPWQSRPYRRF